MIDDETGYIKIDQFSIPTAYEFRQASESTIARNEKTVLDLRNNGGGVLEGATQIADEFLKDGLSIVKPKGEKLVLIIIPQQIGVVSNKLNWWFSLIQGPHPQVKLLLGLFRIMIVVLLLVADRLGRA